MPRIKQYHVGFTTEGSFLPIRNGTNYSIQFLMEALYKTGKVDPNILIAYRGWDDPEIYKNQKFGALFLPVQHYYDDDLVFNYATNVMDLDFVHIFNSDEVLDMGKRLQRTGVKIIYEVINIDHVLYSQFWTDQSKLEEIRNMQKKACLSADYVMCRSEIDKGHLLDMGVPEGKISIYRGAIDPGHIEFKPRLSPRYKILFLGHMYYPPNEEALKLIVNKVLPSLREIDDRYTVTVVGNTPDKTLAEYANIPGLIFLGGQDNLGKFLQDYDIGIAPLYQGSGTRLKLLDYLASGLPTITTNLGIEGLHRDIKNHLIVEDDIEKYAGLVDGTMRNMASYKSKSESGRKFIEEKYNWNDAIQPFLDVYQKLKS